MSPKERPPNVSAINTRLAEAAMRDEDLELILVVRGRVRRAAGADRWRIKVGGRHALTFGADAVVAMTPIRRPRST